MTTRENSLRPGVWSKTRSETGSPVTADAALSASFPVRRALLNTYGYDTILARAVLTGGAGPDVTIDFYAYDDENDAFALLQSEVGTDGNVIEVECREQRVFAHIPTVNGNPTGVDVLVSAGKAAHRTEV